MEVAAGMNRCSNAQTQAWFLHAASKHEGFGIGTVHYTASELRALNVHSFDQSIKFTVVRNPFMRTLQLSLPNLDSPGGPWIHCVMGTC